MRVVAYVSARDLWRRSAEEQRAQLEAWATRHHAHIVTIHEDRALTDGPLYVAR